MPLLEPPNIEELKEQSDIKGLIRALRYHPSPKISYKGHNIREHAAKALGLIGDNRAVKPLVKVLKDRNEWMEVRENAAAALGKIGDFRAIDPLIWILLEKKESDIDVIDSARRLSTAFRIPLEDTRHTEIRNRYNLESTLRQNSYNSLQEMRDTAIQHLKKLLKDGYKNYRTDVVNYLTMLGWKPSTDEASAWYWIEKKEWSKCVEIGDAAIKPLIKALKEQGEEYEKALALAKLYRHEEINILIHSLEHPDFKVRETAAKALVMLFQSDKIKNSYKKEILSKKETIVAEHRVYRDEDGWYHDIGIGIDFPKGI